MKCDKGDIEGKSWFYLDSDPTQIKNYWRNSGGTLQQKEKKESEKNEKKEKKEKK